MFWDDVRTVDYLVTRPEVDPKRVGCVGLSVGGLRACHLAALDDRVKAAVAVVDDVLPGPAGAAREEHHRPHQGRAGAVPAPGLPGRGVPGMPAALLVINGCKDGLFHPDEVKAAFDKLAACYAKAGIPGRLRARVYDAPPEFNARMQAEAWGWLTKWV